MAPDARYLTLIDLANTTWSSHDASHINVSVRDPPIRWDDGIDCITHLLHLATILILAFSFSVLLLIRNNRRLAYFIAIFTIFIQKHRIFSWIWSFLSPDILPWWKHQMWFLCKYIFCWFIFQGSRPSVPRRYHSTLSIITLTLVSQVLPRWCGDEQNRWRVHINQLWQHSY